MKKAFKIIMIIILSLIIVKIVSMWIEIQGLKKKYPEISIDVEGEIKTQDGYITLYPYKVDADYTDIRIFLKYELNDEMKEKGFNMHVNLPDFTLKANPDGSNSFLDSGVVSERVLFDGESIVARFEREKVGYEPQDLLRLYLWSAYLGKEVNTAVKLEIDETPQVIELKGIGKLIIEEVGYDDENQNTVILKARTESSLKNCIIVEYSIYAEKDGVKIEPSRDVGRGGSGSDNPLVYTIEEKFYVDEHFRDADNIYLDIHEVSTEVDNFSTDKPYIDFKLYKNSIDD